MTTRTWDDAFDAVIATKHNANQIRWQTARKDAAFDVIRHQVIVQTQAESLLKVLRQGTISTNIYLRRLHNFALDMEWLLRTIIPKRQWPKLEPKEKRAITAEEHQKIIAGESNPELRDFYELLWQLGGSQTDTASLRAEDIDWETNTMSYTRLKSGTPANIRFGEAVEKILRARTKSGCLFPQIIRWKESDRAQAFSRRLRLVGVSGVSLHSYRYAWAERAKTCGYPERFAQQALGHGSKAVARAYARRAVVEVPALEDFEKAFADRKVIKLKFPKAEASATDFGELQAGTGAG